MKNGLVRSATRAHPNQKRRQKNFQRGQWKKLDRKITPLSLLLLYQYHFENPGGATLSTPMILTPIFTQLGHYSLFMKLIIGQLLF